jgi:long-chain-fatty-acid---luciferin-component ligase
MALAQDVISRITKLNDLLAPYIPPRDTWTPADEAIFKPVDLYRVPLEEARDMQLKAIKFTFIHHYSNNYFYHKYCEMKNVRPDDIKNTDDLDKIPLIPDITFKQHPSGKDFARWLATMFTGDLPNIVIKGTNPTFDEVINAFNAAGIAVTYSSGTSGLLTVIPRDMKTLKTAQYGFAKSATNMIDLFVDHALMCFPNPTKTNLFMGRAINIIAELSKNVHYAMDFAISSELIQRAMSENAEPKGTPSPSAQSEMLQKIVDQIIQWLEHYDKTKETISLTGPPFLLLQIMNTLQKEGKRFDFGERGPILTGGGWRMYENVRIPLVDFRKQVYDVLGIPEAHCVDGYGMCESNGVMVQCPEGHYFHTPYTYYKPLVVDDDLTPIGCDEWGRFAFLDAIAQSYPGFIISGDRVRLLERCPVCDRPGPVLEPEVERAKGEEVRGCAEEVRSVLAEDLAR